MRIASSNRRKLARAGVVVAGGVLLCCPAIADDRANIVKLLSDQQEQAVVLRAAAQSAVVVHNPCASARFKLLDRFIVVRPIRFDASGGVVAGAWAQAVDEEGCGAARQLNVIIVVKEDKSLAGGALLPGTTRADPFLQRDSVIGAFQASVAASRAAGEAKDCKTAFIADTKFIDQETAVEPGGKSPPWREMWTFITCTKRMEVPMRFMPNAKGTAYAAGPSAAVNVFALEGKPN
jgi:hypothetical protein